MTGSSAIAVPECTAGAVERRLAETVGGLGDGQRHDLAPLARWTASRPLVTRYTRSAGAPCRNSTSAAERERARRGRRARRDRPRRDRRTDRPPRARRGSTRAKSQGRRNVPPSRVARAERCGAFPRSFTAPIRLDRPSRTWRTNPTRRGESDVRLEVIHANVHTYPRAARRRAASAARRVGGCRRRRHRDRGDRRDRRSGDREVVGAEGQGPYRSQLAQGPDCQAATGQCFAGRIYGRALSGSFTGGINSITPTAQEGVMLIDAATTIRTRRGSLHFAHQQAVYNVTPTGRGEFSWILRITAGTGRFAGATGYLAGAGNTPPSTGDRRRRTSVRSSSPADDFFLRGYSVIPPFHEWGSGQSGEYDLDLRGPSGASRAGDRGPGEDLPDGGRALRRHPAARGAARRRRSGRAGRGRLHPRLPTRTAPTR